MSVKVDIAVAREWHVGIRSAKRSRGHAARIRNKHAVIAMNKLVDRVCTNVISRIERQEVRRRHVRRGDMIEHQIIARVSDIERNRVRTGGSDRYAAAKASAANRYRTRARAGVDVRSTVDTGIDVRGARDGNRRVAISDTNGVCTDAIADIDRVSIRTAVDTRRAAGGG